MKYILFIFMAIMSIYDLNSQSCCTSSACYVRLDDISGINTDQYQAELQDTACKLAAVLLDFKDEFKVFDFGFYVHAENFEEGFLEEFDNAIAEADQLSPYYLLFGKQCDHNGIYTKIWVKVKLPDERAFSCMDEAQLEGLTSELEMLANFELDKPMKYAKKECDAMHRLKEFIIQETDCCEMGEMVSGRENQLDNIFLEVFYKNPEKSIKEGSVLLIDDSPKMPELSFKIKDKKYYGDCWTSFFVHLEITYKRTQNYGRSRDDKVIIDQTSLLNPDLKLNFCYNIKYEMEDIHGWNTDIMGGRASLILSYQGTPIDTFKFSIKGKNPVVQRVLNFCNQNSYKSLWFLNKIVLEESASNANSLSDSLTQFEFFNANKEDLWKDWDTQNSRCPNAADNNDGGFGLCQLTNPKPDKHELWDWKANINGAYWLLTDEASNDSKYRWIKNKMIKDDYGLQKIIKWNEDNPGDPVVLNETYGGYVWRLSITPLFEDITLIKNAFKEPMYKGDKSVLDACLIDLFNSGLPQKLYLYFEFDPEEKEKPVVKTDDNIRNYIKLICETKIPK